MGSTDRQTPKKEKTPIVSSLANVIHWIIVVLCFIIVICAGLAVIHWCFGTRFYL
jgi:flagellar basal body-associated protein FliL